MRQIKGPDAPMPNEEQMLAAFKKYDKDGNNRVEKEEMAVFIRA